jgi:hypothetical protein
METAKNYELRKLCAQDIFPVTKILSNIGIKEFKKCFEEPEIKEKIGAIIAKKREALAASEDGIDKDIEMYGIDEADLKDIGIPIMFDIADIVLGNLSSCEEYIYMLLSGLSGMSKKEISELPMATFAEMIVDVIKKEEFKDFIKAVSKLIK